MTRCEHTETAIDLVFSTEARVLPHCPRCGSPQVQGRDSDHGWRLWTCRTCHWEANIPLRRGRDYALDIVGLERNIAELLRSDPRLRARGSGARRLSRERRPFAVRRSVGRLF